MRFAPEFPNASSSWRRQRGLQRRCCSACCRSDRIASAEHALRDPFRPCRPHWVSGEKIRGAGLGLIDNVCVHDGVVSFVQKKRQPGGGYLRSGIIDIARSDSVPSALQDLCIARSDREKAESRRLPRRRRSAHSALSRHRWPTP